MLAQPRLVRPDVEERRRAREVGVAGGDRLVDAGVLAARLVEGAAVGDPVPEAGADGARREAAEERAQDAVPGRAR